MAIMKVKPWQWNKTPVGRVARSKDESSRIGQIEALESRQLLSAFHPLETKFQWSGRGRNGTTQVRLGETGNFLDATGPEASLHPNGLLGGGSKDPNQILVTFSGSINKRTLSPDDITITGDFDPTNLFHVVGVKAKKSSLTITTVGKFSTANGADLNFQINNIQAARTGVWMDPWSISVDITTDQCTSNCQNVPPRILDIDPAPNATLNQAPTVVVARFSEDLQASTVTSASFKLVSSGGVTLTPSSVTYNATTDEAWLSFANPLANDTYQVMLLGAGGAPIQDLQGAALDGNGNGIGGDDFSSTFRVNVDPGNTPPTVIALTPAANATLTQSPGSIVVTFSEPVLAATATSTANFQLVRSSDGATLPATRIDYFSNPPRASFVVNGTLVNGLYTVFVSGSIQDLGGAGLDGDGNGVGGDPFTSAFRVEADTTAPTVVGISPAANVVLTQTPPTYVEVQFSEAIQAATVTNSNNFKLRGSGGDGGFNNGNEVSVHASSIEYDAVNRRARFVISETLGNDVYVAELRGPGGVLDLAGNSLDGDPSVAGSNDFASVFQVNVPPPPDFDPPTVASITPAEQKVLGSPPSQIVVTFSESVTASTINNNNFSLLARGTDASFTRRVPTTLSYNSATNTVTVLPGEPLLEDIHLLRIEAAVTDLAGNRLDGNRDGSGNDAFVSTFAISSMVALLGGDPPDPFGDTTPGDGFGRVPAGSAAHDIESVGVVSDQLNAYFRGTFFGDIQPASRNLRNSLFGFFDIDSDQRLDTGVPSGTASGDTSKMDQFGEQVAGPSTHALGSEFYINLGSEAAHAGFVDIFGTSTGTWLLDSDGGRSISVGETPFVFQPIGTQVFLGDWSGDGRKSLGALHVSTETDRGHLIYLDRDGDGRYDPNEDLDGDGVLDVQEVDIDGDGVVDPNEDLDRLADGTPQPDGKFDQAEDRDADGRLDNDGPFTFGSPTDFPNPIVLVGDTDGDRQDNLVLFDPSTALFLVDVDGNFREDAGVDVISTTFAAIGDTPFVGDFDGDGKAEIAVFRPGVGFVVDADDDFQSSAGDVRMSDFVNEDLNGNGLFNNGFAAPLLNEVADGRDYNNDGVLTSGVSEDLKLDGLFNNGVAAPLLDELTDGRDYNNDGDMIGFAPPGGVIAGDIPVVGDWDGVVETDINGNGSEDLNGNGLFNNNISAPFLNEVVDNKDYNGDGDKLDTAVSEDRDNLCHVGLGVFNDGIGAPLLADVSEDLNGNCVIDGKTVDIGWFRSSTSELYLNRNAAARGGFSRLFNSQTREASEDTDPDGAGPLQPNGILDPNEDRDPDGSGPILPNGILDLNDGPLPFPRFDSANANLIADATAADIPLGQQDFNGDGKDEIGFFRPATGQYFIDQTGDGVFQRTTEGPFQIGSTPTAGFPADVPTVGDLDGDGDSDIGIFRRRGDAVVARAPIFYRNRSFTIKVPLGQIGETPVQSGAGADFVNFGLVVGTAPTFASMTDEVPNICPAGVCTPADPPAGQFDPPGTIVPRPRPFASGPLTPVSIVGVRTDLGPIIFSPPTPPTFTTATGYPTSLIFDMSDAVDPTTVDTTTLVLVRTGGDGVFGNSNDIQVLPVSILVTDGPGSSSPNDQITFVLPTVPALPGDDYRFTMFGNDPVRDVNGVPIDGEFTSLANISSGRSGDGSAEGDFVMPLRIDRPPTITVVRLTKPSDRGLQETRASDSTPTIDCSLAVIAISDVPEVSDTGVLDDGATADCTPTFIGTVTDERIRITLDPISDTFGTGASQPDLAGISAEFSTANQATATTDPNDLPTLAVALEFHGQISLPSATSGGPSVFGFIDLDVDQNPDTGGVAWFEDLNGNRSFNATANLTVDPPVLSEGPLRFGAQSGNPDEPVVPVLGNWFKSLQSDRTEFGLYNPVTGEWSRDLNGNRTLEPLSEVTTFTGRLGMIPLVGNFFDGPGTADDGLDERGEYDPNPLDSLGNPNPDYGKFFIDVNGNDAFDGLSEVFSFVSPAVDPAVGQEDVPIVGDWNGDGKDDVGVYRPSGQFFKPDGSLLFPGNGLFFVDLNGDRDFDASEDRNGDNALTPGAPPFGEDANLNNRLDTNDGPYPFSFVGGKPLVGDWTGGGRDRIGVYLASNSSFTLDLTATPNFEDDGGDGPFIYGIAGDQAVVGDWDASGLDKIGVYRNSTRQFILDFDNNHLVGLNESNIFTGSAGTIPVVGNFDGDTQGKQDVGTFSNRDASTQSSLGAAPASGLGSEYIVDLGSELLGGHQAEDRNGNGVLDAGEDINGNGALDPGFVDVIDAVTGLPVDFNPLTLEIDGAPITLFPDNRGILIKIPLDFISESGDGNVNLGAVVGTQNQITDEVPNGSLARSSEAVRVDLDSDRNGAFDNGTVVTMGFGQFVITVIGDRLEDGVYNGVGANFPQLEFRATDEGDNTDRRLHSIAVDTHAARVIRYAVFSNGTEQVNQISGTLDRTPDYFEVTLDEPLDPTGPVTDFLNYRLVAADGTDRSGFLDSQRLQYNDQPTPRADRFDEDLNDDGIFNDGVSAAGHGPLLNEAVDGVDYNNDGVFAFVSEDRNADGEFQIFPAVPGRAIRIHTSPGLPAGIYTFTIKDLVVDLSGNPLDGENCGISPGLPCASPSGFPPSGDGVAGGDFQTTFILNSEPPRLIALTAIGPGPDGRIANCAGPDIQFGTQDDANAGADTLCGTPDDVPDTDDVRSPLIRQYFDRAPDAQNRLDAPLAPQAFEAIFSLPIDRTTISTGNDTNPCSGTVVLERSTGAAGQGRGTFEDLDTCVRLTRFRDEHLSSDGSTLRVFVDPAELVPAGGTPGGALPGDYYRLTFVGGDPEFNDPTVRFDSLPRTVPIIDGQITTDTIPIVVPANFVVNDINVLLNITHIFPQDLTVTLVGPNGTRVELFSNVGGFAPGGAAFRDTLLDDQATTFITAGFVPFTGKFIPETPLSLLNGAALSGIWTLEIDDTANGLGGTLDSWALIVLQGLNAINVGANVDVSVDAAGVPKAGYQGTAAIDADPLVPDQLAAAYNSGSGATSRVEVSFSLDGGGIWMPSAPVGLTIGGTTFNSSRAPSLAYRGNGTVYVAYQASNGGVPGSGGVADDNAILIARSDNAGATFGPPTAVTLSASGAVDSYNDMPSIAVDPLTPLSFGSGAVANQQGNIYAAWVRSIFGPTPRQEVNLAHSSDGGATFVGDVASANPATPIRVDRSLDCPATPAIVDDCTITRFNASAVPQPIADGNVRLYPLTIEYAPNVVVQDLNVRLNITHPDVRDLDVVLIAPDGTRLPLFTDLTDNIPFLLNRANFSNTELDDEATDAIGGTFVTAPLCPPPLILGTPPYTGSFQIEGVFTTTFSAGTCTTTATPRLAALDGKQLSGIWQLEIGDDTTNGLTGTLNSWSLIVTHESSGGVANVSVATAPIPTGGAFYNPIPNVVPSTFENLTDPAVFPPGTVTRILSNINDGAAQAAVPFTFDFFGRGYNVLCISSNGLLNFDRANPSNPTCNADPNNTNLNVDANPAQPVIAPFWDDLQFTQAGTDAVYYATTGPVGARRFIVQWNQAGGFLGGTVTPTSDTFTFQAALFESSGNIEFRYLDVTDGTDLRNFGNSATVGIRNANPPALFNSPREVVQLSNNQPTLSNNRTIRFVPAAQRELFVAWEDYGRGIVGTTSPSASSLIKVDSSRTAGATFGVDVVAATTRVNGFFDPANPTCNTTSTKITGPFCYLIPAQPDRGITATPSLTFGPGPGGGSRLFLVYTDQGDEDLNNDGVLDPLLEDTNGNGSINRLHDNTDIMLTYSDDSGINWRAPVQVNDDTSLNGLQGQLTRATRASQFFPSISVDQTTGVAHIAWYDARLDSTNRQVHVFYAQAVPDLITGDLTFPNPNVQVTSVASDESGSTRNVESNLGDYAGIVASPGNVAHLAWTDTRVGPGNEEIFTAAVTPGGGVVANTSLIPIQSEFGSGLDGEAVGVTASTIGLPSGDGFEGGNFVTGFIVTDNFTYAQSNVQPDPLLPPLGSSVNPFRTIQAALASVPPVTAEPTVLRVRAGGGVPYVIEPPTGTPSGTITIPAFTTMVVEPGAVIKLQTSNIDVAGAGAALQVLGDSILQVRITSLKNDQVGGDTNGDATNTVPQAADWGGIIFRTGSDDTLSIINHAQIDFGGGPVPRATGPRWDAIYLESARPAITNNVITNNGVSAIPHDAQAAISANFSSFITDTFVPNLIGRSAGAIGPLIRNNILRDNSLNALRLRPDDPSGGALNFPRATLSNGQRARWDDVDIVHVLTTEAVISTNASLLIDPGMIVKMDFAALTINGNDASVTIGNPDPDRRDPFVVFTSVYDDSFGGDTNNDGFAPANPLARRPQPGDWSGIVVTGGTINAGEILPNTESTFVMDEAIIKFAGGQTPDGVVRNALIIGTTAPPYGTGPGFYQITRNQFIDNIDSAITVQPEVLRADDPTTPRVEDPLFRDNILRNEQFSTQRNGLEIGRFADGINHGMFTAEIPNLNQVALGTSSLWNDTDIVHMLGRTLIPLGGAQFYPNPETFNGQTFAQEAFIDRVQLIAGANLTKIDFDEAPGAEDGSITDTNATSPMPVQSSLVTPNAWRSRFGVSFTPFIQGTINPGQVVVDNKGRSPTGSLLGCDPFIPHSTWPNAVGLNGVTGPTTGDLQRPVLPFNEDVNCNGILDRGPNPPFPYVEPDADGDGLLDQNNDGFPDDLPDMGLRANGLPQRDGITGQMVGRNALTVNGLTNTLRMDIRFDDPVYAVGFWLIGSNFTSTNETIELFDVNNNPIRTISANATSPILNLPFLSSLTSLQAGSQFTSSYFIGNDVRDNFFVGVVTLIPISRIRITEDSGDEDTATGGDQEDAVGIDDLFFSHTPMFELTEDPPVVLTLTSLPTHAELLTPSGQIYEKLQSAESLVVKLGDLGRGYTSSPDVGQNADELDGLVRLNVGAGFQVGMDDGIDTINCGSTQCSRAPQDWGTGSAIRVIGIPANEATGEPGARVILTSIRDDSVGPKGLQGSGAISDTDGNGLRLPGTAGGPSAGDWGDIFIGSRAAEKLDAQDIPRPYDRSDLSELARILPSTNHQVCQVQNDADIFQGMVLVANDPCYGSAIIDADIRYGSRVRFQSASVDRLGLPLLGILPGLEEELHSVTVAQSILSNYRDYGIWAHDGIVARLCPAEDILPYLINNVFAFVPTRNDPNQPAVTDAVGVYIDGWDCSPPVPTEGTPFDGVLLHNTFFGNNVAIDTTSVGGTTGLAMGNLISDNGSAGTGGQFNTFNMFFNSGAGFGSSGINFRVNDPNNPASRQFPDSTLFLDPTNLDFRLRLDSRGEDSNENGILDVGEDANNNGQLDGVGFKNPAIDSALSELDDPPYAIQMDDRDGLVQLPGLQLMNGPGSSTMELGPEKDFYGSLRQDDARVQNIGAGGRPWFDIGATESRNFGAPVVQNVQLLVGAQLTAVGPATPGAIVNVAPTEIILTFSEDLDVRTVTRNSFVLQDSTGTVVPISSLTFEPGINRTTNTENTVTIVPSVTLPDGDYQLTLLGFGSDAITDIDGVRLDGEFPGRQAPCAGTNPPRPCTVASSGYDSGNGLPGGNFVATFAVQEAPRITRVIARNATATTALDSDFPPASTFRLSSPPTIVEVTFTEAVNTPLGSFRLTAAGADRLFDTSDDVPVVGQFTFDTASLRGTFVPTNPAAMPSDSTYRVELDGTPVSPTINAIRDLKNVLLDGENNEPTTSTSGNGLAGGDWVGYFLVGNPPPPDLRIFVNDDDPIPDNVSDPQPGTASNPFNTIHSGLAAVDDLRKIVVVLPGTYYENVSFSILDYPGTQDPQKFRDVQLISRDGDRVTSIVVAVNEDLDCDRVADPGEADRNNNGRIDFACDADGKPVNETLPAVDIAKDTNNVTVAGFAITTSGVIVGSAPLSGIGVRVDEAPGTKIQRNTIYDNRTGVLINVGSQSPTPRVENNVIWANNGPGIEVRGSTNLAADIVNNTIVFNTEGVRLTNSSSNAQARPNVASIYNNIITGSSGAGIRSLTTAGASIDFNDVFRNLGGNFINIQKIGTHNISADPLFLAPLGKPASGRPNPLLTDWRLGSFSPAIDAALGRETDLNSNGIPDANEDFNANGAFDVPPDTDHDKKARHNDLNVTDKGLGTPNFIDLGAFERQSDSSGPPGSGGAMASRVAVRTLDSVLESGDPGSTVPDLGGKHRNDDESWIDALDRLMGGGRLRRHHPRKDRAVSVEDGEI